jgi:hypothetical protein
MLQTKKIEVPDLVLNHEEKDVTVKLYREQDPEDPLCWPSLVTLDLDHSRYDLGDRNIEKEGKTVMKAMPVYLYDHSGITISTEPFQSRWDSSKIGTAYVFEEDVEDRGVKEEHRTKERAKQWIEDRVEQYDNYLRGEIYRFELYEDGERTDSCGGFHDCGYMGRNEILWDHIGYEREDFEVID